MSHLSRLFEKIHARLTPDCPVKAKRMRRVGITTGGLAAPLVAGMVLMPPMDNSAQASSVNRFDTTELALPFKETLSGDTTLAENLFAAITQPAERPWISVTIERHDTLSNVFEKADAGVSKAYHFVASSKQAKRLASRLKPGKQATFQFDEQQQWQKFRLYEDKLNYTEVTRLTEGYDIQADKLQPDIIYNFAEATIKYSLFGSANKAGLDDKLTVKLASIFGWDVDFALDIRTGDSFALVYEELFLDGEHIGTGEIVAAEFRNKGKTYQAVRYTDEHGDSNYFTPGGESMRKAFLRTPVDFARISSHFNLRRKHPILHTIRAHRGTDYAASRGTPIRATGAGTIRYKGTKGGYGRTIIIQHSHSYETLYAHMNGYARGMRHGSKVKQGQIIGFVGSSGLATGPHLHYEFHVNGVQRNPVTVKFPKTASISDSEKPRFLAQTNKYMLQLASYLGKPTPIQIAQAE